MVWHWVECNRCDGDGYIERVKYTECIRCNGTGEVDKYIPPGYGPGGGGLNGFWIRERCLQCAPESNGWVTHYYQQTCNRCNGERGWWQWRKPRRR